jgi:hypothetical protein
MKALMKYKFLIFLFCIISCSTAEYEEVTTRVKMQTLAGSWTEGVYMLPDKGYFSIEANGGRYTLVHLVPPEKWYQRYERSVIRHGVVNFKK